ncbi:MAG: hypothetical protein Tsb0020_05420 [Haliangiales bacterium]
MAVAGGRLAPWSRRRALAALASAIAAVAMATAVAGRGCEVDDDGPVSAVQDFLVAVDTGELASLYDQLGPATQAGLTAEAKRASDLAGGAHRFQAVDMLGIRTSALSGPRTLRLIERVRPPAAAPADGAGGSSDDGAAVDERAVVEVQSADGTAGRLYVVSLDGVWRVELPSFASP